MEYDERDQRVQITELEDLKVYISQNESQEVKRRRSVREALRALNVSSFPPLSLPGLISQGKQVFWTSINTMVHSSPKT